MGSTGSVVPIGQPVGGLGKQGGTETQVRALCQEMCFAGEGLRDEILECHVAGGVEEVWSVSECWAVLKIEGVWLLAHVA